MLWLSIVHCRIKKRHFCKKPHRKYENVAISFTAKYFTPLILCTLQHWYTFYYLKSMDNELTEILTLIKISHFEGTPFYIFMNEKGEFRSLEIAKSTLSLVPGAVVEANIRKKGCAGREITELHLN